MAREDIPEPARRLVGVLESDGEAALYELGDRRVRRSPDFRLFCCPRGALGGGGGLFLPSKLIYSSQFFRRG